MIVDSPDSADSGFPLLRLRFFKPPGFGSYTKSCHILERIYFDFNSGAKNDNTNSGRPESGESGESASLFSRLGVESNRDITHRSTMAATTNNQFWKARSKHGRKLKFDTPDKLWAACQEYFEWVEENPLQESKIFCYQGEVITAKVDKMRAMTIGGMCIFLGIDQSTWFNYVRREDFLKVTGDVTEIIKTQKFTGAAADLLNANIISRDLGLADKREHSGPGGEPLQIITSEMSPKEAAEAYASTLDD